MKPSSGPDNSSSSSLPPKDWSERCSELFEEMRRPARAMVARAYGRALSDHEIEDIYSAAWTATLSALRQRGPAMADGELRAYLLTAVASHASKEMRRRSRKPASPFETEKEHVVTDRHQPSPEEIAIGSEARGVARDLLSSLPPRRRAVMLLRYGWGLSPNEVCALVEGLSPRAYRKEVTKGVEQLIESLRSVESGKWCEDREPLIRDLVAGTADESARRQAQQHLEHCRACSDLAARLSGHLHEMGGTVAIASVAGLIGGKLTLIERLGDILHGGREAAAGIVDKGGSGIGTVATSGGAHGTGAIGAAVAAKVAGVGGVGKIVLACLGTGAAATACVAAGVVPGVSLGGSDDPERGREAIARPAPRDNPLRLDPHRAVASVTVVAHAVREGQHAEQPPAQEPSEPEQDPEPAPVAPAPAPTPVEEFDPVATQAPAPASSGSTASASGSGGSSSASSVAQDEFGP
jgi:RNA polymerase sigma factor (sigma-70 family)